jgi:hypothetical protein
MFGLKSRCRPIANRPQVANLPHKKIGVVRGERDGL